MKVLNFAVLFACAFIAITHGQEEDIEVMADQKSAIVVQSGTDENGFSMGTTVVLDSSEMGELPLMIGDAFGAGDFSFDVAGSDFSMLNNPSVQKDLQLVDEQLDQIKAINKEFGSKIKAKLDEMKNGDGNLNFDMSSGFGDLIADLRAKQKEQIEGLLLPNQQERLRQVARQMKMKRMGSERALTQLLADELGISDEQKKKLKEKSEQLQNDLKKQIAELRAKAKETLLQELSSEQRDKLQSLLGDDFVIKEEDNDGRFGGLQRMIRNKSNRRDF